MNELCFTHLNYADLNAEDIDWWIAAVVVVPLVGVSLYFINVVLDRYKILEGPEDTQGVMVESRSLDIEEEEDEPLLAEENWKEKVVDEI